MPQQSWRLKTSDAALDLREMCQFNNSTAAMLLNREKLRGTFFKPFLNWLKNFVDNFEFNVRVTCKLQPANN